MFKMYFLMSLGAFFMLLLSSFIDARHGRVSSVSGGNFNLGETPHYFSQTVGALDKLIWYLKDHYQEGNLDLFIGTRIAEGQLSTLLDHIADRTATADFLSADMVNRLRSLHEQIRFISDQGVDLTKLAEPDYYKHIGGIIDSGVWNIDYTELKKVNKSLVIESLGKESIVESQSDDCVNEMLVSAKGPAHQCAMSDKCWELITSPGFYGYSLTHQLFILEIGVKVGCRDELTRLSTQSGRTLISIPDYICANVLVQTEEIAKADFPHGKRDLFMEQIALCGLLGNSNFFQSAWLDRILSWQKSQGCYGYYIEPASEESIARSRNHRITKREERYMNDGCSSHRSAVAAAALGAHIKFLALFSS